MCRPKFDRHALFSTGLPGKLKLCFSTNIDTLNFKSRKYTKYKIYAFLYPRTFKTKILIKTHNNSITNCLRSVKKSYNRNIQVNIYVFIRLSMIMARYTLHMQKTLSIYRIKSCNKNYIMKYQPRPGYTLAA